MTVFEPVSDYLLLKILQNISIFGKHTLVYIDFQADTGLFIWLQNEN